MTTLQSYTRTASAGGPASGAALSGTGAAQPLLYRMTQVDPGRGLYFYSALANFASRTAYANTGKYDWKRAPVCAGCNHV